MISSIYSYSKIFALMLLLRQPCRFWRQEERIEFEAVKCIHRMTKEYNAVWSLLKRRIRERRNHNISSTRSCHFLCIVITVRARVDPLDRYRFAYHNKLPSEQIQLGCHDRFAFVLNARMNIQKFQIINKTFCPII